MPRIDQIEAQMQTLQENRAANPAANVDNVVAGLQGEIAAKAPRTSGGNAGDPVEAAYRAALEGGRGTSDPFGAGGGFAPPAGASPPPAPTDIERNLNTYGGPDLVNAFQNQNARPGNELDAGTFGQRVKLAGTLNPEVLDKLQTFRGKLSPDDRLTFDEAYFPELQDSIDEHLKTFIDKAHGGAGVFIEGPPRARSPKQNQLITRFGDELGVDLNRPVDTRDQASLWADRAKEEPELYQALVSEGLRPQLAAYNAGAMKQDTYTQAVKALADVAAPKIADFVTAPIIATDAVGLTSDQHDKLRGGVEQIANGLIQGFLTPENAVLLAVGFLPPVAAVEGVDASLVAIRAARARTVVARVVKQSLEGGVINMGFDEEAQRNMDLGKLAEDFAAGAITGNLAEVLGVMKRTGATERAPINAQLDAAHAGRPTLVTDEAGVIRNGQGEVVATARQTPVQAGPILDTSLISPAELTELRNAVIDAGHESNAAMQTYKTAARRYAHGLITPEELDWKLQRAVDAGTKVQEAQRELRNSLTDQNLRNYTRRVVEFAVEAEEGAQNAFETNQILAQTAAANEHMAARYDNAAQSPNAFRRSLSTASGLISGRLPGYLGWIADQRQRVATALLVHDRPVMKDLLPKDANRIATEAADNAIYTGERKWLGVLGTTSARLRDIVEHPEDWSNVSPAFRALNERVSSYMDQKFALLERLGYPAGELRDNYIQHFWQDDPVDIKQAYRGRRGVTKPREIVDYRTGAAAGLTPEPFGFAELWARHNQALNETLADAYFRKTLIDRGMAVKGSGGPLRGRRPFRAGMLAGYAGDKATVEAVDAFLTTQGSMLRNVQTISQRFKNSALGAFDMAVFGQQMLHSGLFGNVPAITSMVNDGLRLMHLPHVQTQALYDTNLGRLTFWARNGMRVGAKAANIETSEGSIFGFVPGLNKLDDVFTKQWTERLADFQYGTLLTPVRSRIAEGNLIAEHLLHKLSLGKLGRDISDPQVWLDSAKHANAVTLTSEGAQRGTRSGIENSAATSANAVRGTLNTIGQLSKLVLRNPLTDPEWHMAAMTLASFAVSTYTVKAAIESLGGTVPNPFNPFDQDWGSAEVGGKRVGIIKERTIFRAVAKSWKAIQTNDPASIAAAWAQYGVGISAPLLGAIEGAGGGVGYDAQGVFQTKLTPTQRLLKIPPVAPIIQKLYSSPKSRTDPVTLSLETAGVNVNDIGLTQQRDEYIKTHNPYGPDDPRHQEVEKSGFSGMEDSEKVAFIRDHSEYFDNSQLPDDLRDTVDKLNKKKEDLATLEQGIIADPYKRTEYRDLRGEIDSRTAAALGNIKTSDKPKTMQGQAKQIYYQAIDEARKIATVDVLKGEDYTAAVADGRNRVKAKLGDEGLQALDRSLLAGATPTEVQFRTDMKFIQDSGYYDLKDAAMAQLKAEGKLPFDSYSDFRKEIEQYAKEQGTTPDSLPAFKAVQSQIEKGTLKWRENHSAVDALLVTWGIASAPRSEAARQQAAGALGRPKLPLAGDLGSKGKKNDIIDKEVDRILGGYLNKQ